MPELDSPCLQPPLKSPLKLLLSSSSPISCIFVLLSQFSLTLIPLYFPTSSLPLHLSIAAFLLLIITGIGNHGRRLLKFPGSAPAFVFVNVIFIWGVHLAVTAKEVSWIWNCVFSAECVVLVYGFYSILFSDPGFIARGDASFKEVVRDEVPRIKPSIEEEQLLKLDACPEQSVVKIEEYHSQCSTPMTRIRYCKCCKVYVRGFDHHCPAFGNCIGQNNHQLFLSLLVGFVMVEASYIVCSTQFITKTRIMDKDVSESNMSELLAISTRIFSILQVLWQVLFLAWHIYCVCANITTDEWINWMKYPEFQDEHVHSHSYIGTRFRNPYDKGVVENIKDFLSPKV
ncbi:protein S-acyltransferase [Ranunculus cassubicifolius]